MNFYDWHNTGHQPLTISSTHNVESLQNTFDESYITRVETIASQKAQQRHREVAQSDPTIFFARFKK